MISFPNENECHIIFSLFSLEAKTKNAFLECFILIWQKLFKLWTIFNHIIESKICSIGLNVSRQPGPIILVSAQTFSNN